ncbi:hypothetical protein [Mesorhizobium sp. BH1-1-4]|uniref:hypothetical protein n=1 Tax=Mesorhizobium sp. BH1-1-4 TaxID=2876662 RepID=UPI0029622CAF|nr:hypothetical protein [Mesorhizobium sp. BH1-1-4]
MSATSASVTVSVPDLDRPALVSVRVADAVSGVPVATRCISGASLVPLMVTVRLELDVPPWLSALV